MLRAVVGFALVMFTSLCVGINAAGIRSRRAQVRADPDAKGVNARLRHALGVITHLTETIEHSKAMIDNALHGTAVKERQAKQTAMESRDAEVFVSLQMEHARLQLDQVIRNRALGLETSPIELMSYDEMLGLGVQMLGIKGTRAQLLVATATAAAAQRDKRLCEMSRKNMLEPVVDYCARLNQATSLLQSLVVGIGEEGMQTQLADTVAQDSLRKTVKMIKSAATSHIKAFRAQNDCEKAGGDAEHPACTGAATLVAVAQAAQKSLESLQGATEVDEKSLVAVEHETATQLQRAQESKDEVAIQTATERHDAAIKAVKQSSEPTTPRVIAAEATEKETAEQLKAVQNTNDAAAIQRATVQHEAAVRSVEEAKHETPTTQEAAAAEAEEEAVEIQVQEAEQQSADAAAKAAAEEAARKAAADALAAAKARAAAAQRDRLAALAKARAAQAAEAETRQARLREIELAEALRAAQASNDRARLNEARKAKADASRALAKRQQQLRLAQEAAKAADDAAASKAREAREAEQAASAAEAKMQQAREAARIAYEAELQRQSELDNEVASTEEELQALRRQHNRLQRQTLLAGVAPVTVATGRGATDKLQAALSAHATATKKMEAMVNTFTSAIAALQPAAGAARVAPPAAPTVIQVHMHTGGGRNHGSNGAKGGAGNDDDSSADAADAAETDGNGEDSGASVNERINAAVKRAVAKIYADRAREDRNNLERRALELEHDQNVQQQAAEDVSKAGEEVTQHREDAAIKDAELKKSEQAIADLKQENANLKQNAADAAAQDLEKTTP